jgi:hypothetical protein
MHRVYKVVTQRSFTFDRELLIGDRKYKIHCVDGLIVSDQEELVNYMVQTLGYKIVVIEEHDIKPKDFEFPEEEEKQNEVVVEETDEEDQNEIHESLPSRKGRKPGSKNKIK